MSSAPSDSQPTPNEAAQKPRDAATLIIVDTKASLPRFLMGRRRPDQVFMPGKFVFPGGRVDADDKDVPSADELDDIEVRKLLAEMKGHPSAARARALALATIRETFEETGLIIGAEGRAAEDETTPGAWQSFFSRNFRPRISELCFFARAITPPGRPRRYDTRFFCISSDAISEDTGIVDEELSDINWYTPQETVELDLPPITRVIIEDLADRLSAGPLGPSSTPVPYYHHKHGTFRRDLIEIA